MLGYMVICPKIKKVTYFVAAPDQPLGHVCISWQTACCLFTKSSAAQRCTVQLATRAGLVQKCAILLQLWRIEVGSCLCHKPEFRFVRNWFSPKPHFEKWTAPRGKQSRVWFNRAKKGRCENTLRVFPFIQNDKYDPFITVFLCLHDFHHSHYHHFLVHRVLL